MPVDGIEERVAPQAGLKIPGLVKRNTIILALSQALVGAGIQIAPALGPLLSVELLGSAALAGAGVSIIGVSRVAVAYPLGRIMDVYGRRVGLALGQIVSIVGAVVLGLSVIAHSFLLFILGMFIFGLGMGAAQQLRLAAADMYPPSRRAEGLGYVLTGSLLGALGGPLIISLAQYISPGLGLSPLATSWLIVPVAVFPALMLISLMRPDPKEIATNLERYYPGYRPEASQAAIENGSTGAGPILRSYPKVVAIVSSFAAQGSMSMIMAVTSLALAHTGHELTAISLSVSIHVIGMYAFSMPLGRLGDTLGRRTMLFAGSAINVIGVLLLPISPDYWVVTLGAFLVGVGWACVNVGATAVIADTTPVHERGRAIGVNDTVASVSGIVLPLVVGPLLDAFGFGSVGILGVLVAGAPLPLLLRLRERAPGKYGDAEVVLDRA